MPCLADELWPIVGGDGALADQVWPAASDELVHPPEHEYPILVDGHVRDRMEAETELKAEKLESRALQRDAIRELLGPRKIQRVVVVPGRLVNIVLEEDDSDRAPTTETDSADRTAPSSDNENA